MEIEKSLSIDATSGKGDTGVGSRIFGTFLTWMADRTNPAFIVATSNNHTVLPPALIRKGRFDQLFWMDLPDQADREEIWSVVIKKYARVPEDYSVLRWAKASDTFTGAEVEEVFKDALFNAFAEGQEISDVHIEAALGTFIPFASSHSEDLELMRSRAKGRLVMVSNTGEATEFDKQMRLLQVGTV